MHEGRRGQRLPARPGRDRHPAPCRSPRPTQSLPALQQPPHLHKHLSRSQPQQLIGRNARVGAADPAEEREGRGRQRAAHGGPPHAKPHARSHAGPLQAAAPLQQGPSRAPSSAHARTALLPALRRQPQVRPSEPAATHARGGQHVAPSRAAHQSHSGVCVSTSLLKKCGLSTTIDSAHRLQHPGTGSGQHGRRRRAAPGAGAAR